MTCFFLKHTHTGNKWLSYSDMCLFKIKLVFHDVSWGKNIYHELQIGQQGDVYWFYENSLQKYLMIKDWKDQWLPKVQKAEKQKTKFKNESQLMDAPSIKIELGNNNVIYNETIKTDNEVVTWLVDRVLSLYHLLEFNSEKIKGKTIKLIENNNDFKWKVQSRCGMACDDMGMYYSQYGEFIKANSWKTCTNCGKNLTDDDLIGMHIDDARKIRNKIRIINQGAVTSDFRQDRLNVSVDQNNIIIDINGFY